MTPRKLPKLTAENTFYWTGGAERQLLIQHCRACHRYQHPPQILCAACHSAALAPEPVSGRGRVETYTVNHQAWLPGMTDPFVFAAIELDEQAGLYIFTNLLVAPDAVRSGIKVEVVFEQQEEVWLPLFKPAEPRA